MDNIVYDITQDDDLQKIIKERRKYFDDIYVSNYGQYGTTEWWANLNEDGLIVELLCKVLKISGTGKKMNFPVFKAEVDGAIYEFECKGRLDDYTEGAPLRLFVIDKEKVFKGDFDGYQLIKVEKQ